MITLFKKYALYIVAGLGAIVGLFIWNRQKSRPWTNQANWGIEHVDAFCKGLFDALDGWSMSLDHKETYFRGIVSASDHICSLIGIRWNQLYPGVNLIEMMSDDMHIPFVSAKYEAMDKLVACGYIG